MIFYFTGTGNSLYAAKQLDPELIRQIFHIPSGVLYRANVLCGWLSPLSHATFPMHNFGYDYLPEIGVSAGFFLVCTGLFLKLSVSRMKKYNFIFAQVEE